MEILWNIFNTGLLFCIVMYVVGIAIVQSRDREQDIPDGFVRWFGYPFLMLVGTTMLVGIILVTIKIWS